MLVSKDLAPSLLKSLRLESKLSFRSLNHDLFAVLDKDALAGLIGQTLALEVKESNCS